MSKDVVYKVPIDGFQYLRKDALNYYLIPVNEERIVPVNTEMFVTNSISVRGTLSIRGRVTIWSAEDLASENFKTVTADYTALASDRILSIDAGSNDVTITLPQVVGLELGHSLKLIVEEQSTYSVTINAFSGDTISGDSTVNLYNYEVLEMNTVNSIRWAG